MSRYVVIMICAFIFTCLFFFKKLELYINNSPPIFFVNRIVICIVRENQQSDISRNVPLSTAITYVTWLLPINNTYRPHIHFFYDKLNSHMIVATGRWCAVTGRMVSCLHTSYACQITYFFNGDFFFCISVALVIYLTNIHTASEGNTL